MSLSLHARVALTEAGINLAKAPPMVKDGLIAAVQAVASNRAGKKLHPIFPKFDFQGFECSFQEGGKFKVRPKSSDVVLAKFYGFPAPTSRWIGVGKTVPEAMKNLALKPKGGAEDDEPVSVPLPTAMPATPDLTSVGEKLAKAKADAISPPPKSPNVVAGPVLKFDTPEQFVKLLAKAQAIVKAKKAADKKAAKEAAKAEKKATKPAKPAKQPGPEMETVGGFHVHNDAGLDQETFDRYARAVKDGTDLLKKRGFGFLLGKFPIRLKAGKGKNPLGNYTGAEAKTVNPEVEIFVDQIGRDADPSDIMTTVVHEIGHHYYYKEIPYHVRKQYAWYFDKASEHASKYGSTKRYEDFAEIFAAFVGKGTKISSRYKLTPDIMQRFRTYLAFDKRIDLKEEETLFDRIVEMEEIDASLLEGDAKEAFSKFLETIRKGVQAATGKEPTLLFPSIQGGKGFESSIKGGGKLKIRVSDDGKGFVAKLHGFPTMVTYLKGFGTTAQSALAAMRPEFDQKPKPQTPAAVAPQASSAPGAVVGKSTEKPKQSTWKWGSDPTKLPQKQVEKPWTPDQKKLRELVDPIRKKPIKRQAAGGVVVRDFNVGSVDDMQILVAKTHPKWGGYWVIPKGGADIGEKIDDTAAREVREETGVEAKVVDDQPFSKTSVFADAGKYDLALIVKTLKDTYPEHAEFIESMKDDLAKMSFTWENKSDYFVMQHVSGEPMSEPDDNEEMSFATWMTVRDALKLPSKVAEVVAALKPRLEASMKQKAA